MSEIDHIFASKGKAKANLPIDSRSPPKKQDKKRKRDSRSASTGNDAKPKSSSLEKRPPPETVIDPSARIASAKRPKVNKTTGAGAKFETKDGAEEERFKDSRGSGPRRKTEEGWSIYKEDELGIGDKGGDTPLCPFDCECCF